MRKCWSLTFGVMFFLSLFIGVAMAVDNVYPMPCLIKANNVTVDGTILTGANADYKIMVKNTSGVEFLPVDTAGSTFGSPTPGRFQYNVTKYDGVDQRSGAQTGQKACIEMYYRTTKLAMSYPVQGSCPAGSGEVTIQGDGESIGFGGLKGSPDDAAHTFATPFTAVTANCQVTANPTSHAFGDVNVGSCSDPQTTDLKNTGTATCTFSSLTIGGLGFSFVSPPSTPFTITPSNTLGINAKFCPGAKGSSAGSIVAISDGGQTTVPLSGNGLCALMLYRGWNLIGLPCTPVNTATGTVLQSIISDVAIVWGYGNKTGWKLYDPTDVPGSTLTTMEVGSGYWIKMNADKTLMIN